MLFGVGAALSCLVLEARGGLPGSTKHLRSGVEDEASCVLLEYPPTREKEDGKKKRNYIGYLLVNNKPIVL